VIREIRRYPVKAMAGESLDTVEIDLRGLVGDRGYAVVDGEGRLATGKNSRRFCRRDAVFEFASRTTDAGVRISGRGGDWRVGDPALDAALSHAMTVPVRVLPEADTPYFDDTSISLVGTASLDWCREYLDVDADPRRLRPNLLVDTSEPFVEETWSEVGIGEVRLTVVGRTERCRMIDIAQQGLHAEDGRWLKALTASREMKVGIYLEVLAPGPVRVGDAVEPTP
jgi:uncharacterized protein